MATGGDGRRASYVLWRFRTGSTLTPGIQDVPVDEAHGSEFLALFDAPGETQHAAFADPLHHPLCALDLSADWSVPGFELTAPMIELVGGDAARHGDDTGHAIDRGDPKVDRTAEVGIVQDGATFVDARIGLGAVAAQTPSSHLAEMSVEFREARAGAKSKELELGVYCLSYRSRRDQENQRGSKTEKTRDVQAFRTLAA